MIKYKLIQSEITKGDRVTGKMCIENMGDYPVITYPVKSMPRTDWDDFSQWLESFTTDDVYSIDALLYLYHKTKGNQNEKTISSRHNSR